MATPLTDPFAAIAKPASSAPPSASAGDPFAAIAQPAGGEAPPAAAKPSLGSWADKVFKGDSSDGDWESPELGGMVSGFVKSAGQAMGGLLDMVTPRQAPPDFAQAYKAKNPQATDKDVMAAYAQGQGVDNRIAKHVQDATEWLRSGSEPNGFWEHVGATGEQVLEYLGTDGLLKMAGGGARVAVAGGRAVQTAEDLKSAQQVAATLKSNPKLAGLVAIGLKASKDAALMAGQTYVHTEDPGQAAAAGLLGGGLSASLGAAGSYLRKIAPKNITIAGEEMPALASQINETGQPLDTGAREAPGIARAQQQGAANVIRNVAQQATAQAIDRINQTRPAFNAIEDTSRMLPAGEGAQPFKFTFEGPGTVSGTEGELTTAAEKIPKTHTSLPAERTAEDVTQGRIGTEPEYIQPAGPGGAWSERTGRSWVERRTPGYMHPGGDVEGAADVAKGGGNLETTNPREAESWLRQLEDLQGEREYNQLPQAQQDAIETQRKALQDQLGIYHASPYAQRFPQANIWDTIEGVRTFGDAAQQIEAEAKPVYTTLDRVSDGQFNKWKEVAKRQVKLMRNPGSEEAFQNAQTKYREATGEINDIIDRHRGQVSTQDYMTAKNAWRDSSRLDELHGVFESMANGVTMEESEQGFSRVMTGRAKRLESYLSDGTNREQLQRLIGNDGLTNLKQITLLLSKANSTRSLVEVLKNTASELWGHARVGGAGGAIGGMAAHTMGVPWYEGMIAGATTAGAMRMVLRFAATSPKVGNMVEYAVRNGLSAQHYAPLIARTIAEPFQSQEQPEEGAPQ